MYVYKGWVCVFLTKNKNEFFTACCCIYGWRLWTESRHRRLGSHTYFRQPSEGIIRGGNLQHQQPDGNDRRNQGATSAQPALQRPVAFRFQILDNGYHHLDTSLETEKLDARDKARIERGPLAMFGWTESKTWGRMDMGSRTRRQFI